SAPFQVGGLTPGSGAAGVLTTAITAAFSRAVDASTLTTSSMELRDSANALVTSSVAYSATTHVATLTPTGALSALSSYSVRVAGGPSGVKDTDGNALAADVTWTFTTAGAATAPVASFAFSEGTETVTADSSGNGN